MLKTSLNSRVVEIKKGYKVHNLFLRKYYEDKGFNLNVTYCPMCSDDCDDCSIYKQIQHYQNEEYWEFEKLMSFINEYDVRNYEYILEL